MGIIQKRIKRNKVILLAIVFFYSSSVVGGLFSLEASEFGTSADFLIKTGISFYNQGRYSEAIHEFKKALLINPSAEVAIEFLSKAESILAGHSKAESILADHKITETSTKKLAISYELDRIQSLKTKPIEKKELTTTLPLTYESEKPQKVIKQIVSTDTTSSKPSLVSLTKVILLDEKIKLTQPESPLELPKDATIIIQGNQIKRFLNISPDILEINRQDANRIIVFGKAIGQGIFHVWDENGRWTFKTDVVYPFLTAAYKEEYERKVLQTQLSEPFKFTYSLDRGSFHTGRRIDETERRSLSFTQYVSLNGETPYGMFDSSIYIPRATKEYEFENLRMGLTDATIFGLEHLNIRLFDFTPVFSLLKFPKVDLRGVSVDAPMFERKLSYFVFSGGVPEGNYTHLRAGLGETEDAYLEGVGVDYKVGANNQYKIYYVHSRGSELNEPVLTHQTYGFGLFEKLGKFHFNSQVASDDNNHIAYTHSLSLNLPKADLFVGFNEDDRDFAPVLGGQPAGGSTSAQFGINFFPTDFFTISNNFTAVRDRQLFNPDDPKRPNYSYSSDASLRLDPHTDFYFRYDRDDSRGSVSSGITDTKNFGLRKQFFFIKRLTTYLNFSNSRTKYFSASSSNYDRNGIVGGLSLNLLENLYWSISKGINFVQERTTAEKGQSHYLETAINYSTAILNLPLYSRFRISYRDEEDTDSPVSLLSGEDRLEFFTELDYRPNPKMEGFLNCRVANIWAEKEGTEKRIDAEVRTGMRFVWDTTVRWNIRSHLCGYVFYDLNSNGIKDKDEQGVENVTINVEPGNKTATTNKNGYYRIDNIVGKKIAASIDLKTIPQHYLLTTSASKTLDTKHGKLNRLDFGITTRSEIVGVVFVDLNGNGKYDKEESSLSGVKLILDDKESITTDVAGQYLFSNVNVGEHTLKIDLVSIPPQYIPLVPVKQTIQVQEGQTLFYNIGLKVSKKK